MSKQIEIKNRFTGAVIFTCDLPADIAELSYGKQIGYAVREAIKAGADLAGADLSHANLAHADLAGADLAGADLADANLADADLAGADLAGADLADADLADADLAGAYLADANLADADLAGADLADADLAYANLADADLAGANLAYANLAGANLAYANLAYANLADANLADADLAGADLAYANLADADLAGAYNVPEATRQADPPEPYTRGVDPDRYAKRMQRFRERNPDVPVVEAIDKKILDVIETGSGRLDMSQWHTCETTHCRAGWAITLAGEAGKALERLHGPAVAGRMIYIASTGRSPHFYASNELAMEDIRACAATQS